MVGIRKLKVLEQTACGFSFFCSPRFNASIIIRFTAYVNCHIV
nr:MAG TPA: hypothetical protein [Bacteriophage sp.]